MKTREMAREEISALMDGELAGHQVDVTLAALRQKEGRADWNVYHQIGDLLRSDDMAAPLSPGFAERMAARLNAEPAIVAPITMPVLEEASEKASQPYRVKRWAMPGMVAAAAMAAVAFVATPQLMVATEEGNTDASSLVVSAKRVDSEPSPVVAGKIPEGVVLRDPRIDEYLLAHQRFSPSLYSSAQYARSAAFAAETGK
ncbi:hypothetical protein GCM10027343_26120 [Noviherbaspirillum agri]